jgi:hypothetical protein
MDNCYRFTFRYKMFKRSETADQEKRIYEVKRPTVMVLLKGKDSVQFIQPFLLDSGADNCFLKFDLAELLGLELSERPVKVKTAGADIEVFTAAANMGLVGEDGYCNIGENLFCYVFSKDKTDVPNIMGRLPLFDKFRITFQQYDDKVVLAYMGKVMARKIRDKR